MDESALVPSKLFHLYRSLTDGASRSAGVKDGLVTKVEKYRVLGPDTSIAAKATTNGQRSVPVELIDGSRIADFYLQLDNILDGKGALSQKPSKSEITPQQVYEGLTVRGSQGEIVDVRRKNRFVYVVEVSVSTSLYEQVNSAVLDLLKPTGDGQKLDKIPSKSPELR